MTSDKNIIKNGFKTLLVEILGEMENLAIF